MIELRHLTKRFEGRATQAVVDDVGMTVQAGELCVLLGPSGCGKTTTLKMINRLIQPTHGQILIGGEDTAQFDVVELRRRIGYAIQQVGLFPNMTVAQNIALVPQMLGWDKTRIDRRIAQLLEMVSLDPAVYARCYPRDLSGGQQQRVGVARALAADPPVMLMDEPFGAIDPINRTTIQDEFRKIQQGLGKTVMFVSHDIDEAMKMADKVAIFRHGKLEQFASPDEMLARPASAFVADFVGADRALKRLRLLQAHDAALAGARVARLGFPAADARALLNHHPADAVVVVDEHDVPLGFLDGARLAQAGARVEPAFLQALTVTVNARDDLRSVMSIMLSHGAAWLAAVDDDGRFIGYVTYERIAELARAACASGDALPGGAHGGLRATSGADAASVRTSAAGSDAAPALAAGGGR
ncbi:ATP-binding cassette domain-containing protein [Paraburkholderia sp. BCC1886]|uniref:ATP-binding cassette domain-containing protein n=1 Tax=Paraburkholderia sp. BCC1886 TaxID=2562670 RepID=UPI0011826681|nr:ABC transporter ATP-binding protein [Paraburkholderia sp. BCC1886]